VSRFEKKHIQMNLSELENGPPSPVWRTRSCRWRAGSMRGGPRRPAGSHSRGNSLLPANHRPPRQPTRQPPLTVPYPADGRCGTQTTAQPAIWAPARVDLPEPGCVQYSYGRPQCCRALAPGGGGWVLWTAGRWPYLIQSNGRKPRAAEATWPKQRGTCTPPGAPKLQGRQRSLQWLDALGNSRGGKRTAARGAPGSGLRCRRRRTLVVPPVTWRSLRRASAVGQPRRTIVIWLILPVVICLSQRLSHACLSISNYTAKLRMAHYISYRLFDSTLLLG
jgi:hypothetical protein